MENILQPLDKKHNIGFFYNATHGNMDDVYHARMTLEGLVTTPSFQLKDEMMEILIRDHRNKVNLIPHSFGGAVTHHAVNMLPKVFKERVMIHAFASAKICTPDLAKTVRNYISTRDFVPYLDFKGKKNRKY